MLTRLQHLEYCKARALALLDAGDPQEAATSMISDLRSHPETQDHPGIQLFFGLFLEGAPSPARVRSYIAGFN